MGHWSEKSYNCQKKWLVIYKLNTNICIKIKKLYKKDNNKYKNVQE